MNSENILEVHLYLNGKTVSYKIDDSVPESEKVKSYHKAYRILKEAAND